MNTSHAPAHRASIKEILSDYRQLKSIPYMNELVAALPYIAIILNWDRQIVFSNDFLLRKLGVSMDDVLGKRPGEALDCINSDLEEAGCGTSENCQVCGAVNTVLKCQETGKTATDECRIRINEPQGFEECLDLEVTATPFHWNGREFIILAARDISSEKRKEALERIFFHDVINTAGTLQGVVDMLKQLNDPEKVRDFVDLLSVVSQDLTEEILNQKSLLAAERGELAVKKHKFYLRETLEHIIGEYRRHELALNKEIRFEGDACERTVRTDPVILRRILSNMIKNALEAIPAEERVSIRCIGKPQSIVIQVHNPGTMPEPVRKQIFQRSFSTKGKGRGLGTYSMKLLGEKYLGGKISFSTSEKEGTCFNLELPSGG
jgi:nitrogen-specific signal transduction histidine kinase